MYSTTKSVGERNDCTDLVVTVEFTPGGKGYSYFATHPGDGLTIKPGVSATVFVSGEQKSVKVTSVRASTDNDWLKRVFKIAHRPAFKRTPGECQERVYYNAPPTTQEPDTMNIKITNKTFVNGTDVKDLSDDQIVVLLRGVQFQIDTLNSVKPLPLRFAKKIQELEDGRRDLIALLDGIEPKEA